MKMKHLIAAAGLAVSTLALGTGTVRAQDHAGHDHSAHAEKKGEGHGHEGQHEDLGTTTVAGLKLTAVQIGKIEAGKEGIFEVELGEGAKAPKAVRLWVGTASAEGSVKAKAEKSGDGYEVHVELPKKLSAGSRLWVEIEPASGAKIKAPFDLKK